METINWHVIATVIAAVVSSIATLGGIMFGLMRGFFRTTRSCIDTQEHCQQNVCKKIDELKKEVKENREIVSIHYAEIKSELGIIKGRLLLNGKTR